MIAEHVAMLFDHHIGDVIADDDIKAIVDFWSDAGTVPYESFIQTVRELHEACK